MLNIWVIHPHKVLLLLFLIGQNDHPKAPYILVTEHSLDEPLEEHVNLEREGRVPQFKF
jgi:hypothetical protein